MVFKYLIITVLFIGCGYKPATLYTSKILGDKIFVTVTPNVVDPQNTLYIKDAFREVILHRLQSSISKTKEEANTILDVTLKNIEFKPIQYDKIGYIIAYKTTVKLTIQYTTKNGMKTLNSSGSFDFPVENNNVISENKKNEAIKLASKKAISKFISLISTIKNTI